jgi:acyl carrier protein
MDMDIRTQVRQFITTNFYLPPEQKLEDSDSLIDSGLVDSTGVLEIVVFIEEKLGVTVDDQEILPENLDSITKIASFVESRKTAKA